VLFQLVADLIEPRVRTAIVEIGAGRAARTDGADDLVPKLDHHAATEEHDVRQLGKWRNRILALGALGQCECVVFERHGGLRLIMSAIERVNAGAVAAQCRNDSTVGVEHNCSFAVALSGAGRDRFTHRFDRERCWNSMRR